MEGANHVIVFVEAQHARELTLCFRALGLGETPIRHDAERQPRGRGVPRGAARLRDTHGCGSLIEREHPCDGAGASIPMIRGEEEVAVGAEVTCEVVIGRYVDGEDGGHGKSVVQ